LGVDAWSTVSPWTKEMVSPRPPEWMSCVFGVHETGPFRWAWTRMDACRERERDDFLDGQQPSPTLLYVHHVSIHACVESHACIFCLFYG
jgi:hypothetical protein